MNLFGISAANLHDDSDPGPTLLDVIKAVLGERGLTSRVQDAPIRATCTSDTQYGKIYASIDSSLASGNEDKLNSVYLKEVLRDLLSRPRLTSSCYEICVFGVCVKYCE